MVAFISARNLIEWREFTPSDDPSSTDPRARWVVFEDILLAHGYRLWPSEPDPLNLNPDPSWGDAVFSGFAFRTPYNEPNPVVVFHMMVGSVD